MQKCFTVVELTCSGQFDKGYLGEVVFSTGSTVYESDNMSRHVYIHTCIRKYVCIYIRTYIPKYILLKEDQSDQ